MDAMLAFLPFIVVVRPAALLVVAVDVEEVLGNNLVKLLLSFSLNFVQPDPGQFLGRSGRMPRPRYAGWPVRLITKQELFLKKL